MAAAEDDNPFRLPPDDQIFLIRQQERDKRAEERERVKTLRVWEKTTASSRVLRNHRAEDGALDVTVPPDASKSMRSTRAESVGRDTRREKENVSDFVAKKREMFLVQMSLDVKKAEILKLDEKAKQKEEALKKSQAMLDEDVARFDLFLQNNDQKAHKAMKDAEDMTKKKQDRLQRIKQLKSSLSAIQSEIAKHREQKEECLKFKAFLEKLTPPEWKEQKLEEKRERKRLRKRKWVEERMAKLSVEMQAEIEAEERAMDEKAQEAAKGRRRQQRREAEEEAKERERELEQRRRKIKRKYPTQEAVEAEYNEASSGEEVPLYFEEPKQLLDVFTQLEESNLFLIQNSQDTEQALEEVQQKFAEMKLTMGAKTQRMKQQNAELARQINEERAKSEALRQIMASMDGANIQDKLLAALAKEIAEVHAACGHDSDHDPETLEMLRAIEAKLEEFLAYLDEAEETGFASQVENLERQKERDRRDHVRSKKKELQEKKNEQRLQNSLKRSQAPIHKKEGKQIMFRSAPLHQARRIVQEDDGYDQAVREHAIFGIWMQKDGLPCAAEPVRSSP
mmetsp:Transcript_44471/g.105386  ORF Transcript_44471/g.105386 Transcript_44471/m.105386 type:complete len:567 (+) Transcript_44471:56-1756(+)